ncbi:methyltransferase domain-containing protein [Dictyobacter kobayashii]|uniref:Methyltransferase type 11 domain-containing protein n=1 Tax=Dictyobacter kobayashii TaxID=2014872 RepID=A0A402AR44_9CHLR|nr:methyltransferase domain-containing protein [Dictyobacter kobayashii]GCE21570.1 hypothetical protein KDK_53700 [Dictyobacter kobayashii]
MLALARAKMCAFARLVGPGGHVTGLDFSQRMVEVARRRTPDFSLPLRFMQGDLHELSFADNTFDRCYAEKTFQHLSNPRRALAELIRVMKPGGLLVIAEADHETQVLDSPYPDVTRRFLRFRNAGMKQPDIAHRLYALCKDLGVTDIHIEPLTCVTTDYKNIEARAHFVEGMELACQHAVVTPEEAELWITAFNEAVRSERFFHAVTWFLTRIRKPL